MQDICLDEPSYRFILDEMKGLKSLEEPKHAKIWWIYNDQDIAMVANILKLGETAVF